MTRPRFQFSLRTVFLLMTLCAVPFAGLGWWSHKARQMRNTANAIIESGGSINFAWDHQPTHWPLWLIDLLGEDYFLHIETVFFSEEGTDEDLVLLKGLTQLERLNIQNSQVTDAGLEHVKGLTTLKWIDLHNTRVTNDGVQRLQRMLPNCKIFHGHFPPPTGPAGQST